VSPPVLLDAHAALLIESEMQPRAAWRWKWVPLVEERAVQLPVEWINCFAVGEIASSRAG